MVDLAAGPAAIRPSDRQGRFAMPLGLVLLTWIVLGLMFHHTIGSMLRTWTVSASYNHGFLILPISLWLAWRERQSWLVLAPHASPVALLPLALGALLWVAGAIVDVLIVQQLAFVAMLVCAAWALLGTAVARALAFPLLFLFLAVPAGRGLEPPMMELTADWTVRLVRASGVPVYQEGLFFYLPTGSWSVVEACSGVRYLIASVTLGLLYAYLNYTSFWRRGLFILAAILVPIVANILRAYGIVMLGHLSNMKLATGVDHLIYGWIFFGFVMLLLFWIGGFWQESHAPEAQQRVDEAPATSGSALALLATAVFSLAIALAARGLATDLRTPADVAWEPLVAPQPVADWRRLEAPFTRWQPVAQEGERFLAATYAADAPVALFARQVLAQAQDAKELVPYGPEWTGDDGPWRAVGRRVLENALPGSGRVEERRLQDRSGNTLLVWGWYSVGGEAVVSPYRVKWLEMRQQLYLRPRQGARIFIATRITEDDVASARETLADFVSAHAEAVSRALAEGIRYRDAEP